MNMIQPTITPDANAADPQWYKDAIIYQVHVKSFFDANDDGIGDFPGLIAKLDYIVSLGVNVIWLLPFYPSPRLDDGYDISEYKAVHPDYGTAADVKRFIRAAHDRGIRVITELVINHTSDQHPWFQRARAAKPGSPHRNFYVWSDNNQLYSGTRIIFLDTERSNWTWDATAGAYFWHRFYSHQPDLNFDNPAVLKAVLGVMRFWLDLGVDGLRLDAVPYLIERDGTSNENLPETHAVLKQIRADLDASFPDRMLLAEANMWPEDTQAYFGEGDECHMAFHFPLMPRMYMAIAQEDRFPITDIMRQTPDIPEACQWAIFLRNHDELTLEMVTDKERDYLWNFYATDKRARINLGIRRRLAPLLERDRRRIELMNSLLLSMPGTPVIYYGDELGMGDNIFLGDRDGVRTPMQWSPDRNGGFSKADPASLVLPPVMDPLYGFDAVNVEAQTRDAHSLLNWTRRILGVRKEHKAFGRGALRFLYPKNRKAFAYLREYDGETILCVANLSRSAQAFELDLSEFAGRHPIEMLGNSIFPAIGQLTYLLTLPPYGFYWFILAQDAQAPSWHAQTPEPMPDYTTFVLRGGADEMITPQNRAEFEANILPPYLAKRRWFAAKDQKLDSARVVFTARIGLKRESALVAVEATHGKGTERYLLPLGIGWDDEATTALPQQMALARVRRGRRTGFLTDAFALASFIHELLALLKTGSTIKSTFGQISFRPTAAFENVEVLPEDPVRWLSAEQSNSSVIIDHKVMLKLFRRLAPGQHPEAEMSRVLTERGFRNAPALLGEIVHVPDDGEAEVMAVIQAFIPGEGDAWEWTSSYIGRVIDDMTREDVDLHDQLALYEGFSRTLGQRLGEMHRVLAQETEDEAFKPLPAGREQVERWLKRIRSRVDAACENLSSRRDALPEEEQALADSVLERRDALLALVEQLSREGEGSLLHRIHGDFHLGQVLVASGDAMIIDFEGEPAQPLAERRAKDSGWRDVAGILRSLDYALAAGRRAGTAAGREARYALLDDAFRKTMPKALLQGYHDALTTQPGERAPDGENGLLELFMLEKAAYEINYEVSNRPEWLVVPLRGMTELMDRLLARKTQDD
ncbi:maltose alpha-D-glucosyltransferase [Bosea sp. PAMC 26642]|uniref:maltose alpha-D-glucosyltransferase n=1 Tax=Bosea sp. (strain PAMC 26642) TaxID=1792307 RepID=UPI0007704EFB|nr:maltose alpha-D-glucosyltransferase [Bosea sp. PAMC 26642]AMJ59791.1 alpha-amylase [Bosea sp. PAMC 26642]